MKKSFLALALLSGASGAAQAQSAIGAGTVSLGGSVGYSRQTDISSGMSGSVKYSTETTRSQFSISPSIGYFLADNLALGISLGYNSFRRPYSTSTPAPALIRAELDPSTTLRVGPFVQYYKMISDQFGVLGTLDGGFQATKNFAYTGSGSNALIAETKSSGVYGALTPGIVFFPIPKVGLSASIGSIGYQRLRSDYPTNSGPTPSGYEDTSSDFGAYFGLSQLQFGGTFFLGRK